MNYAWCISVLGDNPKAIQMHDSIQGDGRPLKLALTIQELEVLGKYKEANKKIHILDSLVNAAFASSVNHSLSSDMESFYDLSRALEDSMIREAKTQNQILWISALCIVIILILVMVILYYRQQQKIEYQIVTHENLNRELDNTRKELYDIAEKLSTTTYKNKEYIFNLHALLKNKCEMLEKIGSIVNQKLPHGIREKKILSDLEKIWSTYYMDEHYIAELEKQVDKIYDNLMSDLQREIPNLRIVDRRLYLYLVLQLSYSVIMILMKEDKVTNVYNRRRHLKERIINSKSPFADRFLSLITTDRDRKSVE